MPIPSRPRLPPRLTAALAIGVALLGVGELAGQGTAGTPLSVMSKDGRRPLAVTVVTDLEFVALDDLAAMFQLSVREDSGAITVSYKGRTIVLTPEQALASVSGRLISLPSPPVRGARRWLVPVEFVGRALAPIYDTKLDLRKASHLLVVGDLRVPRVIVRYEPGGTSARLTLDATPRAQTTVSQEDERLIVKFDADALDPSIPSIPPGGLVQAVRLSDPVTLAVDLGPRFAAFRASTQPMDPASRLVIDLAAAQTEAPPAQAQPPSQPPPPPDLGAQPAASIRTIAVDAGHGGEDEGAKGMGGTREKDLTLAVARRIKALVEGRLGIRVLLTRDDDRNVPLDERTAMANNNKADLLISVHANASRRPSTSGASIYYAVFDASAEATARTASTVAHLPAFGGGSREIDLVPWDLAQIRHVSDSAELADGLARQFDGKVPLSPHPVERAPLRVLESANMPAVSIEMGFLSNAEQETALAGAEFQNTFVAAVVDGVVRFRDFLEQKQRPGAPSPAGPGASR